MAGKSNKSKNRRGSQNSSTSSVVPSKVTKATSDSPTAVPVSDSPKAVPDPIEAIPESPKVDTNGVSDKSANDTKTETSEIPSEMQAIPSEASEDQSKQVEGEANLFPVSVKAPSGEKLELRLSPGDSVMDLRQFLVDAPETCFYTCYDLILHTKDGSVHSLEDHNEISEVADITSGGCSLEMVDALYDDRSIRAHLHRTRELVSLSTLYASLSTSLALQQDKLQKTTTDGQKSEAPELEGLGFMENIGDSLCNLVPCSSKSVKCVESIVFSSFNPPPSNRRLLGDLIYIDVVTLEGRNLCITGTTKTFFVNSSTKNILDPRSAKIAAEATTLIGVLQKISEKFKKAFHEILNLKSSAHPFESVQSPLPPNSWLGESHVSDHKRDAARAEGAVTLSFGSELVGMQRDWNEELQSCREFPHTTPQERILRGRALYKVTSDFVDAAISGAVGVITRCIPPINPTDPECFHMYVHNNIFFSFAVDADLGQLTRNLVSNAPDSSGTASSKIPYITGDSDENNSCVLNAVEPNGVADPDVSADSELADSDQATYASANNDLKGTKAYQEADVPGLYNLAMAIIDYRGYRLVAQSIIPGILQGDKSDSLLYGSVDNGKKICWNEAFHSKVLEAAKRLHVKEHTVLDGSGNAIRLAAPVECKGIVGADERHYLLDLNRITPRDVNYTGPGTRNCVLRHELVSAFCKSKVEGEETSTSGSKADGVDTVKIDSSDVASPKPSAETSDSQSKVEGEETSISGSKADGVDTVKIDSSNVASPKPSAETSDSQSKVEGEETSTSGSKADGVVTVKIDSSDVVSPKLSAETSDSQEEESKAIPKCDSGCAENGSLSDEILLNPNVFTEFKLAGSSEDVAADEESVRKASFYLKNVVIPRFVQDLCSLEVSPMDGQTLTEALHAHGINVRYIGKVAVLTKRLPHVRDLCATEIIVRSAKHIFKEVLRETQDHDLGLAVSHFFNCFFGHDQTVDPVLSEVHMKDRASHRASGNSSRGQARMPSKKNQSSFMHITSECLWSDIREFAKLKYQFDLPEDARSLVQRVSAVRNLCQKVGVTIAAHKYDFDAAAPFQSADILNLQPVVKHSVPLCSEAKELVETGKVQLAEGVLNEAYTSFSEAFSILQQITGPMHREVANCCRYLAMVLYHAGDMAGALTHQHKELIINERCLGLDHPDTAHSYGNMALFYHGLNQPELALRHMSRTMLLLGLSCGPDHPDVAATFINVAMMYQDIGKMNVALRYLQEALEKNKRLLGKDHIQTAVCYHAIAIAFNCVGAFKLSLQHETSTYNILVNQLGEEDSRARDSQNWINTFKMRELQASIQKQKGQEVNAASAQRALEILKANPDLLQQIQASAAGGSGNVNPSVMGETHPRGGRGGDERAARAAADARKKAAARGLLKRPQALPLAQLLEMISSPPATGEANGARVNGSEDGKDNGCVTNKEAAAPVGLGATLEPKKPKKKPKSGA